MSFASFVHNLQQKPEPARWRYLYISIAVIMFLVVVFWTAQIHEMLASRQSNTTKSESVTPFTDMKLLFLETSESIKQGWTKFKQ